MVKLEPTASDDWGRRDVLEALSTVQAFGRGTDQSPVTPAARPRAGGRLSHWGARYLP